MATEYKTAYSTLEPGGDGVRAERSLSDGGAVEVSVTPDSSSSASRRAAALRVRRWRPSLAAVWTAIASLVVTAALTITALALYNHNENRLLRVRVRELGLVF